MIEKEWKYAVYYDPFKGAPTEYEMYDLENDPLETTNLAHPTHFKPSYADERTRLHNRLIEVMQENGTLPDETAWPSADDFEPARMVGAPPLGNGSAEIMSVDDQLHRGIKIRRWIYTIIFLLMSLNALYQVIFVGANLLSTLGSFAVGGLLGTFIFSHMSQFSWDEEEGQVVSSMDLTGLLTLVGYLTFVVIRDTLLDRRFDGPTLDVASASVVSGIMLGQLYMIRSTIQKILGLDNEARGARQYEAQIDIDAPVESVWQVFTDFAQFGEWNPLLTSVEAANGRELAVDASLTVRVAGIPGTLKSTVTDADPPFTLGWIDHVPLNLLTPRFGVVLEPLEGERTRFTVQESFEGPLLNVIGRRLDRTMPPLYTAMCQALKARVAQLSNES